MRILAIETSCDETAVSILEAEGTEENARFRVLGNALLSQIDIHKEYGGVFPAMAKREHAKNLVPLLESALREAGLLTENSQAVSEKIHTTISELLTREPGLTELFLEFITKYGSADIDVVTVTAGPGLEPALWVGVNFARALAVAWDKPIIQVNHLEGHILSAIARDTGSELNITHPALPLMALGIAGGHTDLVLMTKWLTYEIVGGTLDDSVGEAFDKVARMLGLPYPGGPEISRLAEQARAEGLENPYKLPRPMLHSNTCDFSFSGLKTAVLYLVKKIPDITEEQKKHIAEEFENAAAEVLWAKTSKALEDTGAQTLVVSGGVSANKYIRRVFEEKLHTLHPNVLLCLPPQNLTTDNAIMIGIAGYYRALKKEFADLDTLVANGNLSLAK